jgi:hypothetical protein
VFTIEQFTPVGFTSITIDLLAFDVGLISGGPFFGHGGSFNIIIFFGRNISLAF